MEVFVIGYERKTNVPFAFFVLTALFIRDVDVNKEIERLYSKYETLVANDSYYRAAGNDQVLFHFSNLNELENILLTEPEIIKSIKELNLRLMRKGGTIYSPYHCFDLANEIIE